MTHFYPWSQDSPPAWMSSLTRPAEAGDDTDDAQADDGTAS
jgi:hypothetical protein